MARDFMCTKTEPVVQTKAGKLRGFRIDGVYAFHGVKYADAKRFQQPEPVQPWEGIKNALAYGYVCPMLKQDEPNNELMVPHRYWPLDENCQYLNIWTKSLDPSAKKPVLVWLHGGGFAAGSSIEHIAYEGENMSRYGDVVVVSLNHRLNILGYLDLSPFGEKYANSGNAGSADMVAALQWIHDNIAGFGGDPDNVTLFGQSGGGMKVWTLMQTPAADGLFHKGIVQSGCIDGVLDLSKSDGTAIVTALMQALGGPLCGVFEQVLSEYEGELPEVEKGRFEAGNGVVGTVDGSEILIGSRALLLSHGVEAPEQALEDRYATGSCQILYVAADGVLSAMFILTYNADRKKKAEIAELELNGVSLLVRSSDANLTPQFIGRLFGIDASAINVIGAETDSACDRLVTGQVDRADAYVATKGRVESMMSVVSACIDEKKNISFIVAMQNAAVIIGFVLVAFLTFIAGVSQISSFALFIYELFWLVAAVILPRFKNKIK